MYLRSWLCIATLLAIAAVAPAKERVWTSVDGRTMRGEFVRELDGDVTFLVAGKLATIPLDRLSDRDQQVVRDLAAGKEVADESPPPSTASDPIASPPAASEPASPAPLIKKPKVPASRVWTEAQGRQYTAKFVRVFDGKVVLTRAGGTVSVRFYDLSAADQDYVKEVLASRGEEALVPIRPSPSADAPAGGRRMPGGFGPMGPPGAGAPGLMPPGSGPPGSAPAGMPIRPLDSGITAPPAFAPSSADDVHSSYGPSGSAPRSTAGPSFPASSGSPPTPTPPLGVNSPSGPADYRSDTERMMRAQQEQMDRSQSMFKSVPVCSACRSTLTDAEAQGTHCPRCGARWAFNLHTGSSGSATAATGPSTSSQSAPIAQPGSSASAPKWEFLEGQENKRAIYGAIAIVVVLAVVVAIIIGVLAVAFAVASASRAGRQYNNSGRM